MRCIVDYANFGANHVGGMGSRRVAVCCIHLLPSSRSRARSLPVCLYVFSLSARALSFLLALLLFLLLALILFLSFTFSICLWRKIDFSTNWKRSTLLRQRCQLALRGRRSEFRRAKKGLKKCHHSRTYQTETVSKEKPCQKWTCLISETVSKVQRWLGKNNKRRSIAKNRKFTEYLSLESAILPSKSVFLWITEFRWILLAFAMSRNHADAKC